MLFPSSEGSFKLPNNNTGLSSSIALIIVFRLKSPHIFEVWVTFKPRPSKYDSLTVFIVAEYVPSCVQIHRKHFFGGSDGCDRIQGKERINNGCMTKRKRTGILLSVLTETAKNTKNTLMGTSVNGRFLIKYTRFLLFLIDNRSFFTNWFVLVPSNSGYTTDFEKWREGKILYCRRSRADTGSEEARDVKPDYSRQIIEGVENNRGPVTGGLRTILFFDFIAWSYWKFRRNAI